MTDALARERAAKQLDVCIALDAGAGSGKTSVLVERVVALLESDVDPRSIAAITFTEKAAGELVARVRDSLETKLAANPDSSVLARALDRFGELTISTIHSFCRDILTHESLEADFAPNTEVGDENLAEQMLIDALRIWRDRLRREKHELWALLEQLVTTYALREAATTLYRYRALKDVACTEPFDAKKAMAELAPLLAATATAGGACKNADDKLLTNNADFLAFMEVATQKAPAQGALEALTTPLKSKKGGQKGNWPGTSKQTYLDCLDAIEEWRLRWREHVHGDIVSYLRAYLFPLLDARRHEDSVATFDDLLMNAARLLRDRPAARARLAARYRAVLVDEVQDTDPVQAEVATLLARPLSADGAWHTSSPDAGRLFAVGDPKQSIYRFRGADVATFSRLRDVIARNGERAALTRNFRSVPDIVAWVNATFADFPGYTPQVAQRSKATLDPIVAVDASDDVDEIDAALRHLRTLFGGTGGTPVPPTTQSALVVDKHTGEPRALRKSDVMILLPSWGKADPIADRFRSAGYECVVEGGDTFFERDEVRLGMAALRAFAEPADSEATVFVLRGLFGVSIEELAKHAAAGGSFRFTLPAPANGSPAVADALARLGKIHRGRGTRSLSILFDELLEATLVTAVWAALPDGKSRLANLDKLKAMVRKAEQLTNSPQGAVDELLRIERNVADKDIDRLDKDGDAIRVTSLFKAKGLEAPVVLLLFPRRSNDGVQHVVDHGAGTIALRMGALEPPNWEALKEQERAHEAEERRRWMYVAATRARDQLVVVRAPAQFNEETQELVPPTGCLLRADIQRLGLPIPGEDEHDALVPCGGVNVRVRHADALPPAVVLAQTFPELDDHVDALLAASPSALGDPSGDAFVAQRANALRAAKRGCLRWRAAAGEPSQKVWRPGVSVDAASDGDVNDAVTAQSVGARGGRVIHAVIERLDLSMPHEELVPRGRDLAAILAAQAGLDDALTLACQNIIERILANPLVDDARKAPERWAEVPFTFSPRKGTVISGTIDLCFPLDESRREWAVFDWKSRVPAKDDPLRDRYEAQLRRYGEAVIAGMEGVKVTRLEIVGPYPELGVQAEPDDVLVDVRGDLRDALAALMQRGAPMPGVYDDVVNAANEPIASPDLSWAHVKLAVVVDAAPDVVAALNAIGWTVHGALDETVAQLLGLPPLPPEDA